MYCAKTAIGKVFQSRLDSIHESTMKLDKTPAELTCILMSEYHKCAMEIYKILRSSPVSVFERDDVDKVYHYTLEDVAECCADNF